MNEILIVSLIGLATTSSTMAGTAIGLYRPLSKRSLACILAFAAGALISALAIDLAYQGAVHLRHVGFSQGSSWAFIGGGFTAGAVIYYWASRYLEKKGAAIRFPTRFREYAVGRKQEETHGLVKLLSKCDLLRHMPAQAIGDLLPAVQTRRTRRRRSVISGRRPRGRGVHCGQRPGSDQSGIRQCDRGARRWPSLR